MKKIAIFAMALLLLLTASVQADLVGLWQFDGDALDSSGNGNHGTVNGATYDTGYFGQALNFVRTGNNSGDYVEVGNIGVTGDWTVQFWARLDTVVPTIQYPIGLGVQTPTYSAGIFMAYSGIGDKWGVYDGLGGSPSAWIEGSAVSAGVWYPLAVTKSGTTYTVYMDGVPENSGTLGDIDISDLQIGRRLDSSIGYWYFDGLIDEVRIWNEALTDIPNGLLELLVEIDIKPGSYPNSINPNAGGVIPVAILTTDDFDASTVDPETVALEGAGARGKGKSGKYGSMEDVDGDGDLDLVVQIENVIEWDPEATEATLTGNLKAEYEGTPIEGTDSVNIVPPEE